MNQFKFLLAAWQPLDSVARRVALYEDGGLRVSTVRVFDALEPYETTVRHSEYNDNKMVVVATYQTRKEAQEGHNKWVERMAHGQLPDVLYDVSTACVTRLMSLELGNEWREKKREGVDGRRRLEDVKVDD